eukprot:365337-Chlamydomonas_euryale.AAC.10
MPRVTEGRGHTMPRVTGSWWHLLCVTEGRGHTISGLTGARPSRIARAMMRDVTCTWQCGASWVSAGGASWVSAGGASWVSQGRALWCLQTGRYGCPPVRL